MRKLYLILPLIILFLGCFTVVNAQWQTTIGFDEADWCPASGGGGTIIDADAGQTTITFDVDVVMPDGTTCPSTGLDNYMEGMDGIDDISVSITIMSNQDTDSNWSEDHLDFDCVNDRFDHDLTINGNNAGSSPNDYSFAIIEFTWLNGLCVDIDNMGFDSGSTNGSSEMYEHGLFFVNGALPLGSLGTYTNDDYNGCGGTTQTTIGNFLLGTPMVSEGNIAPGVWTDDGLNTGVTCPPTAESSGTNPDAGTGGNNGVDPCGATDWNLPPGTLVTSFTTVLGLQDVAYDTDGNGFTSSNTGPIARLNEIKIGKACACPVTNPVAGAPATVCELGSEITDWKAAVEATDGTGALPANVMQSTADDAINIQILYSATTGQTMCPVDVVEPSGAHSGTGCASEDQTTYAYVVCDLNGDGDEDCTTGTDDVTITEVGSIVITYNAPAQTPTIAIDDEVCNYTITPACPDDVLTPATFTALPGEDPAALDVMVITVAGCMATFSLDPAECPAGCEDYTATISGGGQVCNNVPVDLFVTIDGGTGPYTVTLSDGTVITGYMSGDAIPVAPAANTTYGVATVMDADGCPAMVAGTAEVMVIISCANAGSLNGG